MSTIRANQWLNLDGTENYKCRAWVNFNGSGTVTIRAAANVASITDNGLGDYTVNFSTPMQDTNYAPQVTAAGVIRTGSVQETVGVLTTSLRVVTYNDAGALADATGVYVAIFR